MWHLLAQVYRVLPLPQVTVPAAGLTVQVVCPVPNNSSHLLPYKPYTVGFSGPEIEVAEEQKRLPFSCP